MPQAWQATLPVVIGKPGEVFGMKAPPFPGQQWKLAGGQSLWMVRAKDWLLAGGGEDLLDLQTQYLGQLSQNGRPGPALNQSWLEADLDWPRLARWLPDWPRLLLLARTRITMTAPNQSLYMTATVTYPKPLPWKFDPWRVPTNLLHDPVISFTVGQDIAACMDPGEPLSGLTDNPLAGQFYVWALGGPGEMGLQTYGAWPVANASNSLQRIATEAAAAFNPALKQMSAGELRWQPQRQTLLWQNVSSILFPVLQVAPETNGQYLMVSFFPPVPRTSPFQTICSDNSSVAPTWFITIGREPGNGSCSGSCSAACCRFSREWRCRFPRAVSTNHPPPHREPGRLWSLKRTGSLPSRPCWWTTRPLPKSPAPPPPN